MTSVHESTVEYNAEGLFERLGYQAMRGADVDDAGERAGPASAILETRLRGAIERLNPHLSPDVVAQVIRTVTTPPHPTAENGSAKEVMKSDTLRLMARELTEMVKKMPKLDWTQRESVRATLRRNVRRLLAKYGYPPDLAEGATQLVLRQAELATEGG